MRLHGASSGVRTRNDDVRSRIKGTDGRAVWIGSAAAASIAKIAEQQQLYHERMRADLKQQREQIYERQVMRSEALAAPAFKAFNKERSE